MNGKITKLLKKTAITAGLLLLSAVLIREALILTRFVQNSDDRKFEEILFSKLEISKPLKVSDVYGEKWAEVCVLYQYDDPNIDKMVIPYRNQLLEDYYFDRFFGIGLPPFMLKNDDYVWWAFFVDDKGRIKKLFRFHGESQLNLPDEDGTEIRIDEVRYSAVDMKKKCSSRDRAFFIQGSLFSGHTKYFSFYEKE